MHHTCVMPTAVAGDQQCPICKTEGQLKESTAQTHEPPYWHQAEFGAMASRRSARTKSSPEINNPSFPIGRMPTDNEANTLDYRSAKDWYVDFRRNLYKGFQDVPQL